MINSVALASVASNTVSGNFNSPGYDTTEFTSVAIDVNVTAVGGTPTGVVLNVDRLGDDGNWYVVYSSASFTAAGVYSLSIGPGLSTAVALTSQIRYRFVFTGGTAPSVTYSASIHGRSTY